MQFKITDHDCIMCNNRKTMDCPNSDLCYSMDSKPYFAEIKTLERRDCKMRNHYGCLNMLFDMFMLIVTGGLWLVWIIARYLRTH